MCNVLLPPGFNPIAVNEYIITLIACQLIVLLWPARLTAYTCGRVARVEVTAGRCHMTKDPVYAVEFYYFSEWKKYFSAVHIIACCVTFRGPCIVSLFQYISNKMQRYTVHLYMETALHVSSGISTHHQEHTQLYLQHLVGGIRLIWGSFF